MHFLRKRAVDLLTRVREYLTSLQGITSQTSYLEPLPAHYTLNVKDIYDPRIKLNWSQSSVFIPVKISGYFSIEKSSPKSDGQKEMDSAMQLIQFQRSG